MRICACGCGGACCEVGDVRPFGCLCGGCSGTRDAGADSLVVRHGIRCGVVAIWIDNSVLGALCISRSSRCLPAGRVRGAKRSLVIQTIIATAGIPDAIVAANDHIALE